MAQPFFEEEAAIHVQASDLRGQVRERNSQLEAVEKDIGSIRDKIQKESKKRQRFISGSIHVDEAVELVAEHQKMRESLENKQTQLKSFHKGSAQEQKEQERAREEVEALQHHQFRVNCQREQDMLTVEELKGHGVQEQENCSETGTRLENARQELSRCRERSEAANEKALDQRKPLSVRLDQFIINTCKQAGLKL